MALSPNDFGFARMSPVCRVLFAGFESDTFALQRAGWQIAVRECHDSGRIALLMNLKEAGIQAVAESLDRFYAQEWRSMHRTGRAPYGNEPVFQVRKMASDMKVRVETMRSFHNTMLHFDDFKLSDMTPQTIQVKEYDIGKLPLFAEAQKPLAEKIIVPQGDISDLLAEIRARQAPNIAEIRDREQRRELKTVQCASILALAA